jgi:hypothetical protein
MVNFIEQIANGDFSAITTALTVMNAYLQDGNYFG